MVSPIALNTVAGLSEQDAIARLKHDGYNELPSAQSRSLLSYLPHHNCHTLTKSRQSSTK
jgi:hypothetical protein